MGAQDPGQVQGQRPGIGERAVPDPLHDRLEGLVEPAAARPADHPRGPVLEVDPKGVRLPPPLARRRRDDRGPNELLRLEQPLPLLESRLADEGIESLVGEHSLVHIADVVAGHRLLPARTGREDHARAAQRPATPLSQAIDIA